MSNEDATLWTAILPVLTLERGVPVFQQIGEGIADGVALSSTHIAWSGGFGKMYGEHEKARVDLNDPQGFRYALGLLMRSVAQEVEARLEAIAAEVERTARHIAEHLAGDDAFLPGADIDTALRMPRGPVVRRKGTLRLVTPQTTVASPTADELAHLYVGDEGDAG